MNIRAKTVLVVLPLIITPLVLTGVVSSLSARNGITSVATQFLRFKSEQLVDYAVGQWELLEQNDLAGNDAFVRAAEEAVRSFAANVTRSETELIFAVDEDGAVVMSTGTVNLQLGERLRIRQMARERETGWHSLPIDGVERVAHAASLGSFGWLVLVTEERSTFYESTNQIVYQMMMILAGSLVVSVSLLLVFTGILTRPLRQIVAAMSDIIRTSDLTRRVDVLYKDETGRLGHTFNIMISELSHAYDHIKGYALRAAVAQTREQKIRNIFQKYVPKDVIEQFFTNPEAMLVGENRVLSLLFSDIRAFTTISEQLRPDEMVESLNQYFTLMVDAIMHHRGIVDKYMGDAIMAFFGAPVRGDDDAYESVLAGLDMLDVLDDFNVWQVRRGRPEFKIGIGVNYGAVTVGNIGTEKKMDYTVIGDMVNLASRLEGLTKKYLVPLIVSESVRRKIQDRLPCRLLDRVVVKGRSSGVGIYGVKRKLSKEEEEGWSLYHRGMELYYERRFPEARECFERVARLLTADQVSRQKIDLCRYLESSRVAESWTGTVEMTEK
jgi:class 3 adenylate cyclase